MSDTRRPDPLDDFRLIEPPPPASRPGPLLRGFGLVALLVAVPVVLVLALRGAPVRDESPLPEYRFPPAPLPPDPEVQPLRNARFPRVYTPGVDPEPKRIEVARDSAPAAARRPFLKGEGDWPIPEATPVAPEAIADPKAKPLGPLPVIQTDGEPPAFAAAAPVEFPKYAGKPIEGFDYEGRTITGACVGGQGRYLFVTATGAPRIQVYDLTAGKLERTIPFPLAATSLVRIAAGANVLVAVDAGNGRATSWPLGAFEPTTVAELGVRGVGGVFLGPSSNGPLVVNYPSEVRGMTSLFLDPATLRRVRYRFGEDGDFRGTALFSDIDTTGTILRAAKNSPATRGGLWKLDGGSAEALPTTRNMNGQDLYQPASVASDGRTAVGANGLFDLETGERIPGFRMGTDLKRAWSVERANQSIVSFARGGDDTPWDRTSTYVPLPDIDVWKPDRLQPTARLKNDADALAAISPQLSHRGTDAIHLFLVAKLDLVVFAVRERLIFWHADPARQRRPGNGGRDAWPVEPANPRPDPTAPRILDKQGRVMEIRTDKVPFILKVNPTPAPDYPLRYEIERGPKGMTIDETGRVTWEVSRDDDGTSFTVIVAIRNEEKKVELIDTWKIEVMLPPESP